jgi:vacuolar-type H+-ATPase subunit H
MGPGGLGFGFGGLLAPPPEPDVIGVLADLNLTPDFNLTVEQKTKITQARNDNKKAVDAWRAEHAKDLEKIQADATDAARKNDREGIADARAELQILLKTAPNPEDLVAKIEAVLTEAQKKTLDDAVDKHREERQKAAEEMRKAQQAARPDDAAPPAPPVAPKK